MVEAQLRERLQRNELDRMTCGLAAEAVPHLYFKGAALAYTHYAKPHFRPRIDADVLIAASDLVKAEWVLTELGFNADPVSGETGISYQKVFRLETDFIDVIVDLHWAISNRSLFHELVTFSEAWHERKPAPALSAQAYVFGPVHAFVIAIIHPIMHHHGEEDPIWWQDQLLLAGRFCHEEWQNLIEFARYKGVFGLIAKDLLALEEKHGLRLPPFVLKAAREFNGVEAAQIFARNNKSLLQQKLMDLVYARSFSERVRLVKITFFPSSEYLRRSAAACGKAEASLPWLYLVRLLKGFRKWLW